MKCNVAGRLGSLLAVVCILLQSKDTLSRGKNRVHRDDPIQALPSNATPPITETNNLTTTVRAPTEPPFELKSDLPYSIQQVNTSLYPDVVHLPIKTALGSRDSDMKPPNWDKEPLTWDEELGTNMSGSVNKTLQEYSAYDDVAGVDFNIDDNSTKQSSDKHGILAPLKPGDDDVAAAIAAAGYKIDENALSVSPDLAAKIDDVAQRLLKLRPDSFNMSIPPENINIEMGIDNGTYIKRFAYLPEYSRLTLVCSTGMLELSPFSDFHWFFDNKTIERSATDSRIEIGPNNELTFDDIDSADSGQYSCEAQRNGVHYMNVIDVNVYTAADIAAVFPFWFMTSRCNEEMEAGLKDQFQKIFCAGNGSCVYRFSTVCRSTPWYKQTETQPAIVQVLVVRFLSDNFVSPNCSAECVLYAKLENIYSEMNEISEAYKKVGLTVRTASECTSGQCTNDYFFLPEMTLLNTKVVYICDAGYILYRRSACIPCWAGQYSPTRGSNEDCTPCPSLTYQPNAASVGCMACPNTTTFNETYNENTTGVTSLADCPYALQKKKAVAMFVYYATAVLALTILLIILLLIMYHCRANIFGFCFSDKSVEAMETAEEMQPLQPSKTASRKLSSASLGKRAGKVDSKAAMKPPSKEKIPDVATIVPLQVQLVKSAPPSVREVEKATPVPVAEVPAKAKQRQTLFGFLDPPADGAKIAPSAAGPHEAATPAKALPPDALSTAKATPPEAAKISPSTAGPVAAKPDTPAAPDALTTAKTTPAEAAMIAQSQAGPDAAKPATAGHSDAITTPKAASTEAEKIATPEAAKTASLEAAKTATPEATKTATPGATKTDTPEAAKTATPEATKIAPSMAGPDSTKSEIAEPSDSAATTKPAVSDAGKTEPHTPGSDAAKSAIAVPTDSIASAKAPDTPPLGGTSPTPITKPGSIAQTDAHSTPTTMPLTPLRPVEASAASDLKPSAKSPTAAAPAVESGNYHPRLSKTSPSLTAAQSITTHRAASTVSKISPTTEPILAKARPAPAMIPSPEDKATLGERSTLEDKSSPEDTSAPEAKSFPQKPPPDDTKQRSHPKSILKSVPPPRATSQVLVPEMETTAGPDDHTVSRKPTALSYEEPNAQDTLDQKPSPVESRQLASKLSSEQPSQSFESPRGALTATRSVPTTSNVSTESSKHKSQKSRRNDAVRPSKTSRSLITQSAAKAAKSDLNAMSRTLAIAADAPVSERFDTPSSIFRTSSHISISNDATPAEVIMKTFEKVAPDLRLRGIRVKIGDEVDYIEIPSDISIMNARSDHSEGKLFQQVGERANVNLKFRYSGPLSHAVSDASLSATTASARSTRQQSEQSLNDSPPGSSSSIKSTPSAHENIYNPLMDTSPTGAGFAQSVSREGPENQASEALTDAWSNGRFETSGEDTGMIPSPQQSAPGVKPTPEKPGSQESVDSGTILNIQNGLDENNSNVNWRRSH